MAEWIKRVCLTNGIIHNFLKCWIVEYELIWIITIYSFIGFLCCIVKHSQTHINTHTNIVFHHLIYILYNIININEWIVPKKQSITTYDKWMASFSFGLQFIYTRQTRILRQTDWMNEILFSLSHFHSVHVLVFILLPI